MQLISTGHDVKKSYFRFYSPTKAAPREPLNLIAAAEQHVLWKLQLGHHVHGRTKEALEASAIGQDGVCQLGAWIHGHALQDFRDTTAYRELQFAHTLFHDFGAAIVEKINDGDQHGAIEIYKNEYSLAMQHIIQSLTKINRLMREI
ncbi:MAG: CZB domain-containing protein [Sideroxydans sp.]|nr:CZB domain-containing protein [Sideroxydans sp.]